jgi:hypothetical protein
MAHGCLRGIETHGGAEPSDSMGPERDVKAEVKLRLGAGPRSVSPQFRNNKKGWAARTRQHSDRPVFLEATLLPDELAASPPAGANRVASISAASLSGSKGVLDPKAQVHARRGVTH